MFQIPNKPNKPKKTKNTLTFKQQAFVNGLAKNNYNVTQTALKAGYSESYASTKLHSVIRKGKLAEYLKKYFNEEEIKRDIVKTKKRLKRGGDNTNYCRLLELQTKILGLQKDVSEVTNKNPDQIIVSVNNKVTPEE